MEVYTVTSYTYTTIFRPIRRKEVILTEYPHVSGPSRERPGPVCVECLADVSASVGFACVCGLPLCGRPSCLDGPNHRAECELLQGLQGASSRGSQRAGCQGHQGAGCQGLQGASSQGPQEAGCQGLQVGDSQGLTEVVWDSDTLQRLLDDLLPLRNAANMFNIFLFLFYMTSSSPYFYALPTTNLFLLESIS
jgi:hypothetical protein